MRAQLEPWRLFFPSALLLAPVNVLAWLAVRDGMLDWPAVSAAWHGREMVFGYAFAVVAGYLLPTLDRRAVLTLWLLWLTGRVAALMPPGIMTSWQQLLAGAVFPVGLALLGVHRFRAVKRVRNLAFPGVVGALGIAGLVTYATLAGWLPTASQSPAALSVYVVVLLIMVVGGRAVPTATIGSLRARGHLLRLPPTPWLEPARIFGVAALLLLDALGLQQAAAVVALLLAGLIALQMRRWHSRGVLYDPETWPLHLGFFWIGLGLTLVGLQRLGFILPPDSGALHALAAGGIGTMTLAMLLRIARQRAHYVRPRRDLLQALQVVLALAVLVRVAGGWLLPAHREFALWASAAAWLFVYGLGAVVLSAAVRQPWR